MRCGQFSQAGFTVSKKTQNWKVTCHLPHPFWHPSEGLSVWFVWLGL